MTFSIQSVKRTRSNLPPRVVVYGPQKLGKSTFASCAPAPIFIQTEDGLDEIDAQAFPLCTSWQQVLDAVAVLYNEKHDYKTVVLDTADWAEKLLHSHLCEQDKVTSIELVAKGYGKGYVVAAEHFMDLLDGLNALRKERGMGVIILSHTEIKRFDDPLAESYDRYQIKLHKQVGKLMQEWADVIGFAQLEAFTQIEEKNDFKKTKRARALGGRRVLRLQPSPAFDAGNRYGLPDEIDLAWAAFQAALDEARAIDSIKEAG